MIITDDQIREEILQTIQGNRVMLFMKGTPDFPRCGFSARTGWPTIPQLFIDGELVGGCDIVSELHESGELRRMVAPAA